MAVKADEGLLRRSGRRRCSGCIGKQLSLFETFCNALPDPRPLCGITLRHGKGAEDTDTPGRGPFFRTASIILFPCRRRKCCLQCKIGLFRAVFEAFHAVCFNAEDRHAYLLLQHTAKGLVICADDRRHRCAHDGDEFRLQLFLSMGDLLHQGPVPAHNGIHVPETGTEDGGSRTAPAGLVKAADIAGAAARIQDHHHAAQLVQYGNGTGLVRRKGCQIFSKSAHHEHYSFSHTARICSISRRIPA